MNVVVPYLQRASVASALLGKEPLSPQVQAAQAEVDQARQNVDQLEHRLEDTRSLLGMSFLKRSDHCSMPELKAAAWNQGRKIHVNIATYTLLPMALALGVVASNAGLNPIVGFAGAAAIWYGYLKTARHVILPLHVDRKIVRALKTERQGLEQALPSAREQLRLSEERLQTVTLDAMARLDRRGPVASVHVDEAAVTLGGVRLKVRRH